MTVNTGFIGHGYNYRWFVGQVPPVQNQYQKESKWKDAWGDRVRVRIPGMHPQDAKVKDDNLPWAIVAKPTSHGNYSGGSTGIAGGEWVVGFFLDEAHQIPVITHVLGKNIVGDSQNNITVEKAKSLGSTYFKDVPRFGAAGFSAGATHTIGGTKPNGSAAPFITSDDIFSAKAAIPESTGEFYR